MIKTPVEHVTGFILNTTDNNQNVILPSTRCAMQKLSSYFIFTTERVESMLYVKVEKLFCFIYNTDYITNNKLSDLFIGTAGINN